MTLRTRLTLLAAGAVAVAVACASFATYVVMRDTLYDQLDADLRDRARAARVFSSPEEVSIELPTQPLGGAEGLAQAVRPAGALPGGPPPGLPGLPVSERTRSVASGIEAPFFEEAIVDGLSVRIYTEQVAPDLAMQVGLPLDDLQRTLSRLRLILLLVGLAGVGGAALVGLAVARSALRPVRRLSVATAEVTATGNLRRRVQVDGDDELARLGLDFNHMLDALERSVHAQRQLVADASHELRTPLTSVRTNLELLSRGHVRDEADRAKVLESLSAQIEELTHLVADLVELAREGEQPAELEDVRLDVVVEGVVERVRRRDPSALLKVETAPTLVLGVAERLDRALSNLVDNALKWNARDQPVEVTVRGGEVVVRDHGSGIDADDLPRVFDRFYRAAGARRLPGSGLGLAIVRQVAEAHGGSVVAENAADGGAVFRLRLPLLDVPTSGVGLPS
jgi:two-component system sensor histidine kinase MprB